MNLWNNSAKTTTGAFIVPLPGLVVSFGLARWHCQTNKIAPEVRRARDADGGDGGNDGFDGSHCPPPGWVHYLLPIPDKPFLQLPHDLDMCNAQGAMFSATRAHKIFIARDIDKY